MREWLKAAQAVVFEIDECIARRDSDSLTLERVSRALGYSKYHATRKFRALSGMSLRDYLRLRRLAFALLDVRDTGKSLLEIALDHGFSSHEAFTRAFKSAYGLTPSGYRKNPRPVVLRTMLHPFDCYILREGPILMNEQVREISIYFVKIPAHKFLHIKNYDSHGYWDFWEKQDTIAGQDCDTICGLLDSIKGKLDGQDSVTGQFSGQIMAHLCETDGRRPEAYGVRLPADYSGGIPEQMLMLDVAEGEYIVFEHGPFDYETESEAVGKKLSQTMGAFDFTNTGYVFDYSAGRISYFHHVPQLHEKRLQPVKRV